MNAAQLRAFHAVASEGGFTAAARRLNVSQPAVTVQVKALEAQYGVRLFERRGRTVQPTALGRELLALTRRLSAVEDEIEALLGARRDLVAGELRLAADGPYHVIDLLAAVRGRHPGLAVSVQVGNSEAALAALVDWRADVAVLGRPVDDPRLAAVEMGRHEVVLMVPADHPFAGAGSVALAELADQPMVLREAGSATREAMAEALAVAGIVPRVALEIGSREAVREAVAAGFGIGVVQAPEFGHDDRLAAVRLRDARVETGEWAVALAEREGAPIVRAVLDLARTRGRARASKAGRARLS
jgi:aminoethylphosphonate catabolism LysR family transcriptional regulator